MNPTKSGRRVFAIVLFLKRHLPPLIVMTLWMASLLVILGRPIAHSGGRVGASGHIHRG